MRYDTLVSREQGAHRHTHRHRHTHTHTHTKSDCQTQGRGEDLSAPCLPATGGKLWIQLNALLFHFYIAIIIRQNQTMSYQTTQADKVPAQGASVGERAHLSGRCAHLTVSQEFIYTMKQSNTHQITFQLKNLPKQAGCHSHVKEH